MKNFWIYVFCFILLDLSIQLGHAQTQSKLRFQHFDQFDGLGANDVTLRGMRTDTLGFVWIQHYTRLSRFDGYNFKIYNHDPNDPQSLPLNAGEIFGDLFGNIWFRPRLQSVGEKYQFIRYDISVDGFVSYTADLNGATINDWDFYSYGPIIWLAGLEGRGLAGFNYETNQVKWYVNQLADSLARYKSNSVHLIQNHDSFLVLGTDYGLWKFDIASEKFSRMDYKPDDPSLELTNISGIIRAKKGLPDRWLLTPKAMVRVDSNFKFLQRWEYPKNFWFGSMFRDTTGIIWMGGRVGLFRFDPSTTSLTTISHDSQDSFSLRSNYLSSVMVDMNKNLWVGTTSAGISVAPAQYVNFNNFKISGRLINATVYSSHSDDYLIVFLNPKREIDNHNALNEILIARIDHDHPDSLHFEKFGTTESIIGFPYGFCRGKKYFWISLRSKIAGLPINPKTGMIERGPIKWLIHDPKNPNTISRNSMGIFEDVDGNLWAGSRGNGISKIIPGIPYGQVGSVLHYVSNPNDSTSVIDNRVWDFFSKDAQAFWVVTEKGVDLFQNNRFEHLLRDEIPFEVLRTTEGLTYIGTVKGLFASSGTANHDFQKNTIINDYEIRGLKEDALGRLWLCNPNGVACYDPKEKILIELNENDGIDYTSQTIQKTSRGFMVTVSEEGITIFDPTTLKIDRRKTRPLITRLEVNNKTIRAKKEISKDDDFTTPVDITVLDKLVIDHQHNNFSLEFSAMETTAPRRNKYQYKLEGYNENWIEADWKNRKATYTNLPADDYVFRLKATNHHGIWGNEKALAITVLPPPWKTWWAYTGYGFLVLGVLYAARRNIVYRERLKANLQLEKVEHEKEHFELEKVKEIDQVKTSFFTNISHEFRTPLTLIKGPIENLLEEFADNPKVIEHLKLVQRNSDLLLKLINQLLDLAKLESGTLQEEKSEGRLNTFIKAIVSSFSTFAHQKGIELTVTVPEVRYLARFDKDKLEAILINLINNAIKFTPVNGTVKVIADVSKPNAQTNNFKLVLSVQDTGIGIPYNQQFKIFERFHQVSETHKEVGTGIGLALVKELVALMKGIITVNSEIGKGSEFKVELPIEIILTESLVARDEENPSEASIPTILNQHSSANYINEKILTSKPHILVVEDNSDLRTFIIESLGDEFYFLEAEHGKQGLEIAIREVPDFIISDVMMPEMDGITMTGIIKKDIRTSHIPLLLLTAKSTEDSKLSGLQRGADDYLTKPFNKKELLLKVRNRISRQVKLREKLRAELMSTAPKVEVLSENEKFLNSVKEKILERLSDEQLSVESLADNIGMSRVQLYRKISGLTGMSVNELIRKLRLQRAAQLLQQNWGPVSQVAYEVGFSNLSYFSKVFKEEFGMLPSEYPEKKD